jgi:hypothetical protein
MPLGSGPVPRPRARGNVVTPGCASLMRELVVVIGVLYLKGCTWEDVSGHPVLLFKGM